MNRPGSEVDRMTAPAPDPAEVDEVDELSSVLAHALASNPEALFPDLARAALQWMRQKQQREGDQP